MRQSEFDPHKIGRGRPQPIEQPPRHNATPRTGIAARRGSMSTSRCGDACIAPIRASPLGSPLRRRNSSAAMTTTSSRPCTVTCGGPSLRARRTSSLKRALASCRSQWPGCRRSRIRRRSLGCRAGFDFIILVMLIRITRERAVSTFKAWRPADTGAHRHQHPQGRRQSLDKITFFTIG